MLLALGSLTAAAVSFFMIVVAGSETSTFSALYGVAGSVAILGVALALGAVVYGVASHGNEETDRSGAIAIALVGLIGSGAVGAWCLLVTTTLTFQY